MKIILIFVILLLMTGCGGAPLLERNAEQAETETLLTAEKIGAIKKLAQMGTEYYILTNLEEEASSIEIQLFLNFNPLNHEEVMILTDSFTSEVAGLFTNEIAVNVAAFYTMEGWGEGKLIGESMFIPQTGMVLYKHFGRDHVLGYGDP